MAWMFVIRQRRHSQLTKKRLFRNVPANTVNSTKKLQWTLEGQINRTRVRDPNLNNEGKLHTKRFLSKFIVDGADAVGSFVMRSKICGSWSCH